LPSTMSPRSPSPAPQDDGGRTTLPFPVPGNMLSGEDMKLLEWMPKARRARYLREGPGALVFSGDDVKVTLRSALDEQRRALQQEFTAALDERLREQFDTFTHYAEDALARRSDERRPLVSEYIG